ncbi:MAG: hypothetical protein PHP74_00095 [Candidatus Gracilibacteria bacterium]|nr:hypothetical protein [Candidatus Gracilibacteria bacterium]
MNIQLSWDLFVLVFFVVIVAYSFIIGRDNTLKVILGTYVAALAADSVGSLFGVSFKGSPMFIQLLSFAEVGSDNEAMVFVKVLVFVGLVILFAVRGAFEVNTIDDRSGLVRLVLSILYAVMSAGLIISVILVFISGVSFVGGGSETTTVSALWNLSAQSNLIKGMLNYTYLWFSMPALAFLIHSIYSTKSE